MATEAPAAEAPAEEKKKKPILLIILGVVGVIVVAVGVAFGTLYLSGYYEKKAEIAAMDKVDELEAAAAKAKDEAPQKTKKEAPEATKFEKNYMQMEKDLMTNITGSKKVMVVQVALMTHYDNRVFDNIKKHEFAIRSAVLDVMRQTTEPETAKPEFRKQLADKIKDTMNEMLEKYVDAGIKTYRYNNLGLDCEHFFVVSHKHRIAINRHINYLLAERKDRVMFLQAASKCHGVTMQPQNMILWVGIELLCCARRYRKNSPVSGAVYVVQSWDAKHVIVRLHAIIKERS